MKMMNTFSKLIKNNQGSINTLLILFVVIVSGNIFVYMNKQTSHQELFNQSLNQLEKRSIRNYLQNIIDDKEICQEVFKGQEIQFFTSKPPFGENFYGVEILKLEKNRSTLVEVDQFLDQGKDIKFNAIMLKFSSNPNIGPNFMYPVKLMISVDINNSPIVEVFDLTVGVAYVVGTQMQANGYQTMGYIQNVLQHGCVNEMTAGAATGHTISDIQCSQTFPQRFCMGNCLFKRSDTNRIFACL